VTGEYLFSKYGKDSGDVAIDYVNFHWYVTDQADYTAGDTQALRDTIDYVQRVTGKRAMTNEIGQYGLMPAAVTGTLNVLMPDKNLPWALWLTTMGCRRAPSTTMTPTTSSPSATCDRTAWRSAAASASGHGDLRLAIRAVRRPR